MKQYILIFLFIVTLKLGFSQVKTVYSLDDCMQRALAENLDLKIQRNHQKQAMLDRKRSQWQLSPSINGWSNTSLNMHRSTDQNNDIISGRTYSTSYGIGADLTLFSGLTKLNTIAAMKYNELVFEESTRFYENQLYLEIMARYSAALYQKSMIMVYDEQLQNSFQERDRIVAFIANGKAEEVALYEIEATVSSNQLAKKRAENSYQLTLLQLAQLIELPNANTFDIADGAFQSSIPENIIYTYETVYSSACTKLPEVLKKEYQIQYLESVLKVVKGRKLPSLSMSADYNSNYFSSDTLATGEKRAFLDQFENYQTPRIGISLSIPIFNGLSKNIEIEKSKIDLENSLYELENQKKLVGKEIIEAIQRLNALQIEYEAATKNLGYVEKSYETYLEKFHLGLISSTDYITAQNQLSQAKASVISAKYSWIVQQMLLELYMGNRNF